MLSEQRIIMDPLKLLALLLSVTLTVGQITPIRNTTPSSATDANVVSDTTVTPTAAAVAPAAVPAAVVPAASESVTVASEATTTTTASSPIIAYTNVSDSPNKTVDQAAVPASNFPGVVSLIVTDPSTNESSVPAIPSPSSSADNNSTQLQSGPDANIVANPDPSGNLTTPSPTPATTTKAPQVGFQVVTQQPVIITTGQNPYAGSGQRPLTVQEQRLLANPAMFLNRNYLPYLRWLYSQQQQRANAMDTDFWSLLFGPQHPQQQPLSQQQPNGQPQVRNQLQPGVNPNAPSNQGQGQNQQHLLNRNFANLWFLNELYR